jgi:hypothetical protein
LISDEGPEGIAQQLVMIPAQYQPLTNESGVERRFREITYTVYHSNTNDFLPPTIWTVEAFPRVNTTDVAVQTTDFSGVVRVVVAYTIGDGRWQTIDLNRSSQTSDRWTGILPFHRPLEYVVQVVDGGGKVTIEHGRGRYLAIDRAYWPLVFNMP